MLESQIKTVYVHQDSVKRPSQGDILTGLKIKLDIFSEVEGKRILSVAELEIPFSLVMTQECDLDQDLKNRDEGKENQDRYLRSILICPAYSEEEFRKGEHLKAFDITMRKIGESEWDRIKSGQDKRYQYLEPDETLKIPSLIVDFKHYYAISREGLYNQFPKTYLGSLNLLFRESLSQRFSFFLSRVALPDSNSES